MVSSVSMNRAFPLLYFIIVVRVQCNNKLHLNGHDNKYFINTATGYSAVGFQRRQNRPEPSTKNWKIKPNKYVFYVL